MPSRIFAPAEPQPGSSVSCAAEINTAWSAAVSRFSKQACASADSTPLPAPYAHYLSSPMAPIPRPQPRIPPAHDPQPTKPHALRWFPALAGTGAAPRWMIAEVRALAFTTRQEVLPAEGAGYCNATMDATAVANAGPAVALVVDFLCLKRLKPPAHTGSGRPPAGNGTISWCGAWPPRPTGHAPHASLRMRSRASSKHPFGLIALLPTVVLPMAVGLAAPRAKARRQSAANPRAALAAKAARALEGAIVPPVQFPWV